MIGMSKINQYKYDQGVSIDHEIDFVEVSKCGQEANAIGLAHVEWWITQRTQNAPRISDDNDEENDQVSLHFEI
jgi:hypothetical protein